VACRCVRMEAVLLQQVFVSLCSAHPQQVIVTLAATQIVVRLQLLVPPRVHFFVPMEVALAILHSAAARQLVVLRTTTASPEHWLVRVVCV
jgi:hypothetical protein